MAAHILKIGGLDLSAYLRVNPDDPSPLDPYSPHFVEPAWSDTPFSDGQVLISTTVQNREQTWPLFLVDPTHGKDQVNALIAQINNAAAVKPLVLEWRDTGSTFSSFWDVSFVRFEPAYNYRRGVHGYAAGVLRVWTSGYSHTGTVRICATAAGTGIFLSVPIPSVAGDAPALLDTTIVSGAVVPSLGRIVAVAPITNPSYAALIPAASLTDTQTNATLVGASGAQGSQYLALPVQPTGGASGIACKVPLPNPTIAGGDNRILAVVKSGIDVGIGIYALDPFGNSLGATAVASNSQGWAPVDLGVCRLPTVGFPTLPKISVYAGAIWASGATGPLILASPAALAINEVFVLPDKNLTLVYERGVAGAGPFSKDGFPAFANLKGQNDALGNPWSGAFNASALNGGVLQENGGQINVNSPSLYASSADGAHLAAILTDSMVISGKVSFNVDSEVRLLKESATGVYVQGRWSRASQYLDLAAATSTTLNLIASVAISGVALHQAARLSMQVQGPKAFVNLSRDDGGTFTVAGAGGAVSASVGAASNAALAGAGVPGVYLFNGALQTTGLSSWEVDPVASSNILPYDNYRIDGPDADSYRTSSAGAFSGQKLVSVQRGAFPKMSPSTVSLAVVCAPVDQGVANDLISAVVSVKERFSYGR